MGQKLKHRWSISHNYLTGITLGKWLTLLWQNKFDVSPAYFHRAAFITLASLSNSLWAFFENLAYRNKIKQAKISKPPLFILGHWRSGTTHLHDLLSHDTAQFQFANTYQVVNPYTFLMTENFVSRMFPWLVPPKRPMDNMQLKFTSPQEDEFAPLLMSLTSVYLGTTFPNRMDHYDKHLTFKGAAKDDVDSWKAAFMWFCKKLSMNDSRALLLKSPPHTGRIKLLLEMFPDARFVHIHRNPYHVFQSQRHFFDTAGWFTYLQKPDLAIIDEGLIMRHEEMYDAFYKDVPLIPKGRFCEVSFEDLETQPLKVLAGIYADLSLEGFEDFQPKAKQYLSTLTNYKKNDFAQLDTTTKSMIADRWSRSFEKGGYLK